MTSARSKAPLTRCPPERETAHPDLHLPAWRLRRVRADSHREGSPALRGRGPARRAAVRDEQRTAEPRLFLPAGHPRGRAMTSCWRTSGRPEHDPLRRLPGRGPPGPGRPGHPATRRLLQLSGHPALRRAGLCGGLLRRGRRGFHLGHRQRVLQEMRVARPAHGLLRPGAKSAREARLHLRPLPADDCAGGRPHLAGTGGRGPVSRQRGRLPALQDGRRHPPGRLDGHRKSPTDELDFAEFGSMDLHRGTPWTWTRRLAASRQLDQGESSVLGAPVDRRRRR